MAKSNPLVYPRLFLDSGVFLEGIVAPWSDSRGLLILSRRKALKIILAEYVKGEVEDNLLNLTIEKRAAEKALDDYTKLLTILKPEIIPLPTRGDVDRHRHLIRHQADVPVLVSALDAAPDWFLTTNTSHFTKQVAEQTQLRIVTPKVFMARIAVLLEPRQDELTS